MTTDRRAPRLDFVGILEGELHDGTSGETGDPLERVVVVVTKVGAVENTVCEQEGKKQAY